MTYQELFDMLIEFEEDQLSAPVVLNMSGTRVEPKVTDFVYPYHQ